MLLETVHMHVQPYATATPLSCTLHNLQTRRNFGERVLSIFLATIMVAIFDYNSSGRLGRVINLYHGGERRSTIRRGSGVGLPPFPPTAASTSKSNTLKKGSPASLGSLALIRHLLCRLHTAKS